MCSVGLRGHALGPTQVAQCPLGHEIGDEMQYTIQLDIPDPIKEWLQAEHKLNQLYNKIDVAGEQDDLELISELDSVAAPLAEQIIDMGFTNEDAFRLVLKIAEALAAVE